MQKLKQHWLPSYMLHVEDLHPEYVTDRNGVKKSVILPINDFYELLEDLEDLASVAERKDEPTISHEQVVEDLKKMACYSIQSKKSAVKELEKLTKRVIPDIIAPPSHQTPRLQEFSIPMKSRKYLTGKPVV